MPIKILMVCLGNICRSPLAEGILAFKLPKHKFIVDSAGMGNWHVGKKPDPRSIATALKNNFFVGSSGQLKIKHLIQKRKTTIFYLT